MSNTTVLYVPGSFCLLSVCEGLFDGVSKAGYHIKGIHPPTVGPSSRQARDGPAPSMYDDAVFIAREAELLADQGKDVILMGHSYSGITISQCTKGLTKKERQRQGKPGGVVHLAYIACLVPAIGQSAASLLSRFPDEKRPSVAIDENGWMIGTDPAATAGMICQLLPQGKGESIVREFAKHSAQSFADELTHAGYVDLPVSYLLCEEDLAGPPDFQRDMIAQIEEASGRKVDVTSVKADHMVLLSAEKETVGWVVHVARKVQQSQT